MTSWICPVKCRSWSTVKKKGVFGAPKNAFKLMEEVNMGDILFFHILKPVNGIVGRAKVISKMYIDNENIWGKDLYPFRVKIEILNDRLSQKKKPISTSLLLVSSINKEIVIEPYLRNVHLVKITQDQSEELTKIFETDETTN